MINATTKAAKSTYDASWSFFRDKLRYIAITHGVQFEEVSEAFFPVTCSACHARSGPSGLKGLRVRGWQCGGCGCVHDRDINAALNILRCGRASPVVGIARLQAGEDVKFDISERKRTEERLAQLQRELERLSLSDGLTGVGNRRMFDTVIEREWASAAASGKSLSLVMVDIDFFKSYNDYYGHLQGDECLKRIARVLGEAAGPNALLSRFGGEEFMLVLPETDADEAVRVAERCRALIADEAIPHLRSPHGQRVTASFGVGTVAPNEGVDLTAFINLTDAQLYQAKEQGRNRISAVDRAGLGGEGFKLHSR